MPVAKDFDAEDARTARLKSENERTFRINGMNFVHRVAVAPEALNEFRAFQAEEGDTVLAQVLDLTATRLLEPESAARWVEARDPDSANPITIQDLLDVVVWLAAETAGRPTVPSSESSTSSTLPGTTSTADSDSTPAAASPA
jgi:hypothetical protein